MPWSSCFVHWEGYGIVCFVMSCVTAIIVPNYSHSHMFHFILFFWSDHVGFLFFQRNHMGYDVSTCNTPPLGPHKQWTEPVLWLAGPSNQFPRKGKNKKLISSRINSCQIALLKIPCPHKNSKLTQKIKPTKCQAFSQSSVIIIIIVLILRLATGSLRKCAVTR